MAHWYLAKIVFRIVCGDGNHQAQFDEQLRLIAANNPAEALMRAQAIGALEQESFVNQQDEYVHWQFIDVIELLPIKALEDGIELYGRITEHEDADCYLAWIRKKAADISGKYQPHSLELP